MMQGAYSRLHPLSLALALGVLWGVSVFIMGLIVMITGYAQPFIPWLSVYYIGYAATPFGILLGLLWGFADAFIGGIILAWLYNFFANRFVSS